MSYSSIITEDDCNALPALLEVIKKPSGSTSKKMQLAEERKHKHLQIEYNAARQLTQVRRNAHTVTF